jgi:signal transduction histidine kinase
VRRLIRRVSESLAIRSARHRVTAWILAVIGPVIVALALLPVRSTVGLAGFLAGAQLAVVVVAAIGGIWPALAAAAVAILIGAYSYTPPFGTINIDVQADLVAFIGFVIVAAFVGFLIDELAGLARQQAALRRVATLVARAAAPDDLFAAVTEEVGHQLSTDFARMARYEPDNSVIFVAAWSGTGVDFPVGRSSSLEGGSVSEAVWRTRRPARFEEFEDVSGPLAAEARRLGVHSAVGVPILVEDRLWGVMIAGSTVNRALPRDAEADLADFVDLLSTAIANAESRAELAASRARIVAAADETRRRIERDLHDGTQQRLVSLAIEMRAAEARVPADAVEERAMFSHAAKGLTDAVEDLQEISRGIHPAILSKGGLKPAIKTLARRCPIPVELDLQIDQRLPERIEVAAYYVVSEALTNVAKYAQASMVQVDLRASDSVIELAVRDDGIGGADPTRGSGLVGLQDRVAALAGTMTISGGAGKGTSIVARIPFDGRPAPGAPSVSQDRARER